MSDATTYILGKKRLFIAIAASLLLVAYAPMTSIAGAQAAADTQKLKDMKQKAQQEIDRRLTNLQETLKKLEVDVHLDKEGFEASKSGENGSSSVSVNKDGASANVEGKNGSTATANIGEDGANFDLEISPQLKEKVKELIEKFIEKLKGMKEKVLDTSKLTDMQSLGKGLDSQFNLDQLTNIQGTVSKSIESLTSVFDKLKSTKNDLQSQVTKLKECLNGVKSGDGTVDANVKDGKASVKATAPGCDDIDINSEQVVDSAQSQLDNISTIMTTIGSVLSSAIAIVTTLVSSLSGITGGLGDLGSLGDVSNLSSLGNLSGIMSSFTGLTSQLDILNGLSGNAGGLLGNLSNLTSGFNF